MFRGYRPDRRRPRVDRIKPRAPGAQFGNSSLAYSFREQDLFSGSLSPRRRLL